MPCACAIAWSCCIFGIPGIPGGPLGGFSGFSKQKKLAKNASPSSLSGVTKPPPDHRKKSAAAPLPKPKAKPDKAAR